MSCLERLLTRYDQSQLGPVITDCVIALVQLNGRNPNNIINIIIIFDMLTVMVLISFVIMK